MDQDYSVAIAKYDYRAEGEGELTIRKNEKLQIIDDSQPWWKVQNEKSLSGYVPSNYLARKDSAKGKKKIIDNLKNKVLKNKRTSLESGDASISDCQSPKLASKGKVIMVGTAKFKYLPQRDDEIELSPGDQVSVLEIEHDGWCRGETNGKTGWFPYNYIQKVEQRASESGGSEYDTTENAVPVEKPIICKVRTLYAFTSQSTEELSFDKDSILEVMDMPKDDPDWYQARKSSGEIGLIPRNYVETIVSPHLTPGPAKPKPSLPNLSKGQPVNNSVKAPPPPAVVTPVKEQAPAAAAVSEFDDRPWFHGSLSRQECEKLLNDTNKEGEYLIRNSESKVGLLDKICVP